uniref:Peptidylglycine monooxygenase n=2 Tax=Panagrolaimus sp. JU765 TaxID=591449 RepID=A0AC34QX05_9BILA
MLGQTAVFVVCLIFLADAGAIGLGNGPESELYRFREVFQDERIPAGYSVEEFAEKEVEDSELRMPGVTLNTKETYLCTAFPLDLVQEHYLVEFEALAQASHVHHILLFGCDEPGSDEQVWDCGDMTVKSGEYTQRPVCKSNPEILFAWAKNAPKLALPEGVGYKVGGQTKSKNLILQVHYMHEETKPDYSGLKVVSTTIPQPRTASTLLIVTGGVAKAHETTDFEAACVVDEPVVMHPFAFRVHTHSHGTKVSGYVVTEDAQTGEDHWHLIGERNPQLPQLFAPIQNKSMTIQPGDMIASRCTMKNDENRNVEIGGTGDKEMCNFYLAYYVEGDRVLQDNVCYSPGAPKYTWKSTAGLNHIPH